MKKCILTIVIIILFIILLIPIKRNAPSDEAIAFYSYNLYRAGLYTYAEKHIYMEDESHNIIRDEKIKKIFFWPKNDWKRIKQFLSSDN